MHSKGRFVTKIVTKISDQFVTKIVTKPGMIRSGNPLKTK